MKTTVPTHVRDFVKDDLFTYAGVQYKVTSVHPHPQTFQKTNVHVVNAEGEDNILVLSNGEPFYVTKDDGLVGAPTHVVVDLKTGYTHYRDYQNDNGRNGLFSSQEEAWDYAVKENTLNGAKCVVFALARDPFAPDES